MRKIETEPAKNFHTAQSLQEGRLDKMLALLSGLSRMQAKKLILGGHVWHNQEIIIAADYHIRQGDAIAWQIPDPVESPLVPERIPLDVLYEDRDLLVLCKPASMCVHPAPGQWQGTLVNALLHHCGDSLSGIGGVYRPGIVHRIDKDTSGILVVAKNDQAHQHLSLQFSTHEIERNYYAFTKSVPHKKGKIKLEGFIGRHPVNRKKMSLRDEKHGKYAAMHYQCLENYSDVAAKIKCTLYTGRTHQIRVQMAAEGFPLIGDAVYGGKQAIAGISFARQALHAAYLAFTHPKTEKRLQFTTDLPEDMQILESQLKEISKDDLRQSL